MALVTETEKEVQDLETVEEMVLETVAQETETVARDLVETRRWQKRIMGNTCQRGREKILLQCCTQKSFLDTSR